MAGNGGIADSRARVAHLASWQRSIVHRRSKADGPSRLMAFAATCYRFNRVKAPQQGPKTGLDRRATKLGEVWEPIFSRGSRMCAVAYLNRGIAYPP